MALSCGSATCDVEPSRVGVSVRVCSAERACGQRVLDAIVHMRGQHLVRGLGIAFQGALKKSHVLRGRFASAIKEGDHLISEILVEHQSVRFHQHA